MRPPARVPKGASTCGCRRARVWLLADDGTGSDYRHPADGRRGQKLEDDEPGYFSVPYAYWRDGWHTKLRLPGKAMLLIGLSLGNGFQLPYGQVPAWYGISAKTAERGLAEQAEAKDVVMPPGASGRAFETVLGSFALVIATVGLLLDAYALAVVGLVLAAVGYGILLGSRPAR